MENIENESAYANQPHQQEATSLQQHITNAKSDPTAETPASAAAEGEATHADARSVLAFFGLFRHSAELAALQHALQVCREEVAARRTRHEESKKAAKRQIDEVMRNYQAKLNSVESELHAANERMRALDKAKTASAKELEANLAQTMSDTQPHDSHTRREEEMTHERQRAMRCE